MNENENNGNESKEIAPITSENAFDAPKSQEDRFIDEYLDCGNVAQAGRRANYSESVIESGYLYGKFKNPKFQDKFRQAALARDYQDISYGYNLERKAMQEANRQAIEKPETAIENISKLKHTLRDKKRIIGILADDKAPPQPMITIQAAKNVQLNLKTVLEEIAGIKDSGTDSDTK
jgi:hypothetical protein